MTFKEVRSKIKEEQKALAREIKIAKPLRKPKNWEGASEELKRCSKNEEWNSRNFRHRHIIYCHMFNGTPRDKIEQPREGNSPSSHQLDKIKNEWEGMLDDEALCDSA